MKPYRLPIRTTKTARQRARRLLSIRQIDTYTWIVSGGTNEHIVALTKNGLSCDCAPFVQGQTQACSHIIRYYYEYAPKPKGEK